MGSSGGSSNRAQQQAEENERERQAQIAASTASVNRIFDDPSRQGQYDRLAADTTAYYTQDLDRQKAENDRRLTFALARGGQVGGSVQADQSQRMGEDYLRGIVEASRRGQAAGADLRNADEQARMNLLAATQAGLDATTGMSRATSTLQSNLQASRAAATAGELGNMFGTFGDIYNQSRQQAEYLRGLRDYSQGGSAYYKPLYGGRG